MPDPLHSIVYAARIAPTSHTAAWHVCGVPPPHPHPLPPLSGARPGRRIPCHGVALWHGVCDPRGIGLEAVRRVSGSERAHVWGGPACVSGRAPSRQQAMGTSAVGDISAGGAVRGPPPHAAQRQPGPCIPWRPATSCCYAPAALSCPYRPPCSLLPQSAPAAAFLIPALAPPPTHTRHTATLCVVPTPQRSSWLGRLPAALARAYRGGDPSSSMRRRQDASTVNGGATAPPPAPTPTASAAPLYSHDAAGGATDPLGVPAASGVGPAAAPAAAAQRSSAQLDERLSMADAGGPIADEGPSLQVKQHASCARPHECHAGVAASHAAPSPPPRPLKQC